MMRLTSIGPLVAWLLGCQVSAHISMLTTQLERLAENLLPVDVMEAARRVDFFRVVTSMTRKYVDSEDLSLAASLLVRAEVFHRLSGGNDILGPDGPSAQNVPDRPPASSPASSPVPTPPRGSPSAVYGGVPTPPRVSPRSPPPAVAPLPRPVMPDSDTALFVSVESAVGGNPEGGKHVQRWLATPASELVAQGGMLARSTLSDEEDDGGVGGVAGESDVLGDDSDDDTPQAEEEDDEAMDDMCGPTAVPVSFSATFSVFDVAQDIATLAQLSQAPAASS